MTRRCYAESPRLCRSAAACHLACGTRTRGAERMTTSGDAGPDVLPDAAAPRRRTWLAFSPPSVDQAEIDEVADTLRSAWITTGPKTQRFEREFAAFVRAPGALALNSCTAALHTALATLGIGPSDEVITTPTTFVASVNVIEHVGARPVLADVTADTLNIDPERVAAAI